MSAVAERPGSVEVDPVAPETKALPLGVSFADRISVESIPDHLANRIYERHHSYLGALHRVGNHATHGILLDGDLVGAVTYGPLRSTSEIAGYSPDEYVEVSRVCVAVPMPNLASAGMAASQDRFVRDVARPDGIRLLVSYVVEGYEGSMFAALRGKGWREDERRPPSNPSGNRAARPIHQMAKTRWVCELDVDDAGEQVDLGGYA